MGLEIANKNILKIMNTSSGTTAPLPPSIDTSDGAKSSITLTEVFEPQVQEIFDQSTDTADSEQGSMDLHQRPTEDVSNVGKKKKRRSKKKAKKVSSVPDEGLREIPVLNINTASDNKKVAVNNAAATSTDWAEMLDVEGPVTKFLDKSDMAKSFNFELDTFQKQAILKLEEGHHVLVAAHTSAGKTVMAEYAIAKAKRNGKRAIYTSPIKALSNQKFKDFKEMFGDVGLLTGDVRINTTASILVMTTEILRSMLYNSPDAIRDLEVVIFDEMHYVNNAERGYVWEESLILLPVNVTILMLSATVPNALQFADWLGRTKGKRVYVVSTAKRPVALRHYLCAGWGKSWKEMFMVVDPHGNFLTKAYQDAVDQKKRNAPKEKHRYGRYGNRFVLKKTAETSRWVELISTLQKRNKLPMVSFTLSCKRCDKHVNSLCIVDLTTDDEKNYIRSFIDECVMKMELMDRTFLQGQMSSLEKGIAAHHGGKLPLVKEIIEKLFQKGLVKVLFATETFALGMNMPARTVVFDGITKYDGVRSRPLTTSEYIQMAGRAGRRGLDDTGTVIILSNKRLPSLAQLQGMMTGVPEELNSKFKLTYSTILGLLKNPRSESLSVEGMMKSSFGELHQVMNADNYKTQLKVAEEEYSEICRKPLPPSLAPLATFYDAAKTFIEAFNHLVPKLMSAVEEHLVPGRVLVVTSGPYVKQLGVLLSCKGPTDAPCKILMLDTPAKGLDNFNVDNTWYRMLGLSSKFHLIGSEENTLDHMIICLPITNIIAITKTQLNIEPRSIQDDWDKRQIARFKNAAVGASCGRTLKELQKLSKSVYNGNTVLEYYFVGAYAVGSMQIQRSVDHVNLSWDELQQCKKNTEVKKFIKKFSIVYKYKRAENNFEKYKRLASVENLALYPNYQKRLLLLKEMGYIDENDMVTMKGRIACCMEVNELIMTEIIFWNILDHMSPAVIAAVLSCFTFQYTKPVNTTKEYRHHLKSIPYKVQEAKHQIREMHTVLYELEEKYDLTGERMIPQFDFVNVMYAWVTNTNFYSIVKMTDVPEGAIVRCILQLHELLQHVKDAAILIGDKKLESKMLKACALVKRDIIFGHSPYLK